MLQNRFVEASPYLRDAVDGKTRSPRFGPDDISRLNAAHCLGVCLVRQRRDAEAEVCLRDVFERASRVLGPASEGYLAAAQQLCACLSNRLRVREAEAVLRRAIDERAKAGVHDHDDSDLARALGMCLLAQGRHREAEPHLRQAAEDEGGVLARGPRTPDVGTECKRLNTAFGVGMCLMNQERFAEALQYFRRAREGWTKLGERENTVTCDVMVNVCTRRTHGGRELESGATQTSRASPAPSNPSSGGGPRKCAVCGKEGPGLKLCGRCKSVRYCSAQCRDAAWPEHKKSCRDVPSRQQ
jgi:tetratricopeptide (TPR) repeat protein